VSIENWENAPHALDITVRFAETDLMGVVHHSAYVIWFEAGRVAWMEAAGMPYAEIAQGGHHFAVTGVQVEYRTAARFGEPIQVITRLAQLRSRQVSFTYTVIHRDTGAPLATGRSDHICVDLDGKMATIPPAVQARLRQGAAQLIADAA
jgi:acyl-CoA thioester hydrolase